MNEATQKFEAEEPQNHLGMTPEQWEQFKAFTSGFGNQDENGQKITSTGRYPAALEAAYNALIEKKRERTLTSGETLRLQAVWEEISAVDQGYPNIRAQQGHKLIEELAQICAELQSLPPLCPPTR